MIDAMRARTLLVATLCTGAGCDRVFALIPVEEVAEDACAKVGHDEDGDGLDDACDPCPFNIDNTIDTDGDGIAFACDPDPGNANRVVAFYGFGTGTTTGVNAMNGIISNDAFEWNMPGAASALIAVDITNVWVIVGLEVTGIAGTTTREVGITLDASPSAVAGQLDGVTCMVGRNGTRDLRQIYVRNRPNGDTVVVDDDSPYPVTSLVSIRAAYTRPMMQCDLFTAASQVTMTGTPDVAVLPEPGYLGLIADDATARFQYAFVVAR
jgi:hypothetical protein